MPKRHQVSTATVIVANVSFDGQIVAVDVMLNAILMKVVNAKRMLISVMIANVSITKEGALYFP